MISLFAVSCKQKAPVIQESTLPQINNQLTAEEKAGGVMTPEIMWKFGRLGTFTLSPDGSTVLYTVTDIDLQSEARKTNIFSSLSLQVVILFSLQLKEEVPLNGSTMANQLLYR